LDGTPHEGKMPACGNYGRTRPSFSVVICTRNRPELLNRCLAEVTRLEYPNFEVLVVDNAPSDQRTLKVARRWSTRYCVEPEPGLSRARNRGVSECRSEIVAFIDDDEIPDPFWLWGLAGEFEDPLVMVVTGRRLPLAATKSRPFPNGVSIVDLGTHKRIVDRETPFWFEMANFGGIGDGGNMAFRRSAFDIWPGFDVRLGRGAPICGGEEHRAFFSLVNLGYRVVYTPEAVVRHPSAASLAELRALLLRNTAATVAYMALMMTDEPQHRRATLKYLVQGIFGRRRSWRCQVSEPLLIPSRSRKLIAGTWGLLLYTRMRLRPRTYSRRAIHLNRSPSSCPSAS